MKAEYKKGDSYTDRLFHWIQKEENLPVIYERIIKPKVYKVSFAGRPMILKGYRRLHVIQQQIDFFEHWNYASRTAARPVPFRPGTFTLGKLGCDWALFERMEGRHADFDRHQDRKKAVRILHQFHRTTKGIAVLSIPKDPLYVKWERRLEQFLETKDVFTDLGRRQMFQDISSLVQRRLEAFADCPWGEIEERAWDSHEWLHGDVAHHNFIVTRDQSIRMIDFDLLHTGPRVYDHIQLAQRFLPHVESERSTLVQYFPHVKERDIWWKGVLVPSDLLREWLYGYRSCLREESSFTRQMRKLEKSWESRKKFVRYAEHML
ncbi:aminoglycoside phosphotransferase family protein [Halobacillus litoralis]|uniref:aminoglycoside phosphotransferase family protein n=1 Tax=Halobacillus litoralis TaxID=45668 RepID=UPI001CD2EE33|nr:aminoglycoside phosphotransferase family protein [Halobacillus litoralis]MCA1021716.1 aminoglycoside phosphotransferase family protein [Halobacillus litoralis]